MSRPFKTSGNGGFGLKSRVKDDRSGKTDNSNLGLKVAVREWVLERLGEPADLAVLDLYCGERGEMYKAVWHRAGIYLGVDKNKNHKLARTMRATAELAVQELNLDPFNIFDLDCYDSPWIVARRILRRRGPGRFGLVLTSGETRGMKPGHCNEIIRATLGLGTLSDLRLLIRYDDLVMDLMIASLADVAKIRLVSGIKGKLQKAHAMYYFGLVVDKGIPQGV